MSFIDKEKALPSFQIAYLVASRRKLRINEIFSLLPHTHTPLTLTHWLSITGDGLTGNLSEPELRPLVVNSCRCVSLKIAVCSSFSLPSPRIHSSFYSGVGRSPRSPGTPMIGTARTGQGRGVPERVPAAGTALYNKCCSAVVTGFIVMEAFQSQC